MASGLRRLPVGRLPSMRTPGALPTKQLRTPVEFALPAAPTLPNPVAFPLPTGRPLPNPRAAALPAAPPLPNPVAFALPSSPTLPNPIAPTIPKGITFSPPEQAHIGKGAGGAQVAKAPDYMATQGIGRWSIGSTQSTNHSGTFRIFSPHVHNWNGE